MGEGRFDFETYCGKVVVEPSEEAMTPFGGLVPYAAYLKHSGILDRLAETSPVVRRSPNAASVRSILVSMQLTALSDGSRFAHVGRLRADPAIPELYGIERVVSDDTIRRYMRRIPAEAGRAWLAEGARCLWSALPTRYILDWDSTVLTRYGHQEGSEVGYNPWRRGRPSHHPLVAVAAGTRLCLYYRWRSGRSGSASGWVSAMEEVREGLGVKRQPWLNRGDNSFGTEEIMAWHEAGGDRPQYLFKLRMTGNVRRAIQGIAEAEWSGPSSLGVLQVAERRIQLMGWSRPRRVIFGRRIQGVLPAEAGGTLWDMVKAEYEAYVTDLRPEAASPWQVVDLYRQRADTENVFDELNNHWGFNGFCCHDKHATEFAARMVLLTYNMWNLFLRLMVPQRHVEAFQGRRWFLLIAARMVKSGRTRVVKISVRDEWLRILTDGYNRLCQWIAATAPQLEMNFGGLPALNLPPPAAPP